MPAHVLAQTSNQVAVGVDLLPELCITGPVGSVADVQYVTSLAPNQAWHHLTFVRLTQPTNRWADATGPRHAWRFYRVRQLEVPPEFLPIHPGTFVMGSPETEPGRYGNEGPLTTVSLTRGFMMSAHEVTQTEYTALVGNNPTSPTNDLRRPANHVSWTDAVGYCARLTAEERARGHIPNTCNYRLPSEAEWEYACRAGTPTRFSYGDDPDYTLLPHHAWHLVNSGGWPQPVAQLLPNAWGFFDLHGNLWEWCADWYQDSLPGTVLTDPMGPSAGTNRTLRGGSWLNAASRLRTANRYSYPPEQGSEHIGFRVVLAATP